MKKVVPAKKMVTLQIGDKGASVMKYQKLLVKTGSKIKLTGVYTIGMASAVRAFQKKMGLAVTGMLDGKTAGALEVYKAPKKTSKTTV